MTDYPEHEKLRPNQGKSQTIGEFLDWLLNERGVQILKLLPKPEDTTDWGWGIHHYGPVGTIQDLLAEYFDIDQEKLEAEKRAMLAEFSKHADAS